MNDNHQMDEFFRKKLNDWDNKDDNWDKPNQNIWENTQSNRSAVATNGTWNKSMMLSIVLGSLLLFSLGYNFYQSYNIRSLKYHQSICDNTLIEKEVTLLEAKNTLSQNQIIQDNLNDELEHLKQNLLENQPKERTDFFQLKDQVTKEYQQNITQLQLTIDNLRQQVKAFNHREMYLSSSPLFLKNSVPTIIETDIIDIVETPNDNINFEKGITPREIQTININQSLNNHPTVVLPKSIKSKQLFEIGIDVRMANYKIPSTYNFTNINSFRSGSSSSPNYQANYGLHFGYALKKNMFLQTGLRTTSFTTTERTLQGMIYNHARSFTYADGNLYNSFAIASSSPFIQSENEITFSISEQMEDNDWLFANLTHEQSFDLLQIPLGISYFKGRGKWQLEFQGGMTWNRVALEKSDLSIALHSNNETVPIHHINENAFITNNTQYLGAYLGLGAQYEMTNNWFLRTSYIMEDNALNWRSGIWSRRYLADMGWNMSLNYRF